jgi:hypothetical protein
VALAESSKAAGTLEAVHADAETFAAYCAANSGIVGVMANPVLSDSKKKDLIAKMAKEGSFSPLFVSFLNLLVDKRRISLVDEILADFEEIYCGLTDTQARAPPTRRQGTTTHRGRSQRHYPRHLHASPRPGLGLQPRSPVACLCL